MARSTMPITDVEKEMIRDRRKNQTDPLVRATRAVEYVPDDDPRSHEDLAEASLNGDMDALDLLDKRRGYLTEPDPDVVNGIFDRVTETFTRYRVRIQFVGAVIGGTPKDRRLIEGWLLARAGLTDDQRKIQAAVLRTMEQMGKTPENPEDAETFVEDVSTVVADELKGTGFKWNDDGLYIETRQVKAGLKEATNVVYAGVRMGPTSKGAKNFLAENLFVEGLTIPLGVHEPTLTMPFTGHVRDKSGERSTLTYYEVVWQPVIEWVIRVKNELTVPKGSTKQHFGDPRVSENQLRAILEHAQWLGLGSLRSQGAGVYRVVDLTRLKPKQSVELTTVPIGEEEIDW